MVSIDGFIHAFLRWRQVHSNAGRSTVQEAQHRPGRRTRIALATGVIVAGSSLVFALASAASAATLFSDDFNDGNASGWSTSGGSWSASSGAYSQSSSSAS